MPELRIALGFFACIIALAVFDTCNGCSDADAAKPRLQKCLVSCYMDRSPIVCIYDEVATCFGATCKDLAPGVECRPRVTNLGTWDPIPNTSEVHHLVPYWHGN